jgi:hypothetical protein
MAQRGTSEKMAIPQELKTRNSKRKKGWKNNSEGGYRGCCAAPEPAVESIPEPAAAEPAQPTEVPPQRDEGRVVVEVVEVRGG